MKNKIKAVRGKTKGKIKESYTAVYFLALLVAVFILLKVLTK